MLAYLVAIEMARTGAVSILAGRLERVIRTLMFIQLVIARMTTATVGLKRRELPNQLT